MGDEFPCLCYGWIHVPKWNGFLNNDGKTVRADVKQTIKEY